MAKTKRGDPPLEQGEIRHSCGEMAHYPELKWNWVLIQDSLALNPIFLAKATGSNQNLAERLSRSM